MQGKKIIIVLIIINILLVCFIYNFIKNDFLNNEKLILKAMTDVEYEDNITSLNQSHTEYANYIEESKKKIASAITEMGVETSNEETLETMASNIRGIAKESSSNWTLTFKISTSGTVNYDGDVISSSGNKTCTVKCVDGVISASNTSVTSTNTGTSKSNNSKASVSAFNLTID